MKLDFKEIANAWFTMFRHTQEEKQLADKRFDICLQCPSKQEIFEGKEWALKCGECGCALSAKIYTDKRYMDDGGSCPLNKWKDVEIEHMDIFKIKNTKTII